MSDLSTSQPAPVEPDAPHWTARHGKPIIFVIVTLVAVGIYLALTIPVAVFPDTNFPRIVIGADNGVFPIDQMLVTVTKPLEEAVNIVPGLDHLFSITSRGTAEIDLFFNWNADMHRTLELVNAALARVQPSLPSTCKLTANRLTFAAFPIMGYSLTSDTVPQTRSGKWRLTISSRGSTGRPAYRRSWFRADRYRNSKCSPTRPSWCRRTSPFPIFWTPSAAAT